MDSRTPLKELWRTSSGQDHIAETDGVQRLVGHWRSGAMTGSSRGVQLRVAFACASVPTLLFDGGKGKRRAAQQEAATDTILMCTTSAPQLRFFFERSIKFVRLPPVAPF